MSEEEETQKPAENAEQGRSEPKNLNIVEQARGEREKLDSLLNQIKEETAKLEELKAERIFAGESLGKQPEEKKEVDPKDYASSVLKGELND